MKIKTITCHDVYNYGASLQAYALQQFLLSLGHDVEIIDYKPDYMRIHYKFWYVPKSSHYYAKSEKSVIFKFMLCCYFAPKRFATYGRKVEFDRFRNKYLKLTKRYNSYSELAQDAPEANVYIAGSDQIWNCSLPNGKDPAYFLQFGDGKIKRISYAASFAIPEIPKEYKSCIKQWLSVFNAISVREHTGLSILKSLDIENGVEVMDPVFLLSKEKWMNFIGERYIKKKYILVYDLYLNDNRLEREAKRLSEQNDLEIIAIDGNVKCKYAHKNISNAGPNHFVNLIENAEYVITNSFHATAFSLIFNKPFRVYYKFGNVSRISDILCHLGLSDCLNCETHDYEFEWDTVNKKLFCLIESSFEFLEEHLK